MDKEMQEFIDHARAVIESHSRQIRSLKEALTELRKEFDQHVNRDSVENNDE